MTPALTVLYSGSKGNATVLSDGETAVLIDAGRSERALCQALSAAGVAPEELCAFFSRMSTVITRRH